MAPWLSHPAMDLKGKKVERMAQKRASSGTRGDVWQQKARNMPCHICLAGEMSCFLFMIWTDPVMQWFRDVLSSWNLPAWQDPGHESFTCQQDGWTHGEATAGNCSATWRLNCWSDLVQGCSGVSHPQMDGWLVVWWLIGGLEHEFYDFPFSWGFHKPNWRSQIFQRGRYTTNQNGLWRIWIQHFTRTPLLRPRLQRLREAAWVLPRWPEDSVVKRLKQDMFRGYMNSTAGQLDGGFIMFNL